MYRVRMGRIYVVAEDKSLAGDVCDMDQAIKNRVEMKVRG